MASPSMRFLCVLLAVGSLAAAQVPFCQGNGGQGRIETGTLAVGEQVTFTVHGNPSADYLIFMSTTFGVTSLPGVGNVCLDMGSLLLLFNGTLPASGRFDFSYTAPLVWESTLFYTQGVVTDPLMPAGLALTNTLRKDYEVPDTYAGAGTLQLARSHMTASRLPTGWVLMTGGSTSGYIEPTPVATTDIFLPLTRSTIAGPDLLSPRVHHTATTLDDARVLLVGGVTDAAGTVTTACEIYDPATGTVSPAGSLTSPRAAHTASLLSNGRVLVTGGTSTFASTANDYTPIYSGAQDTAEIYDPVTDTWAPTPNTMSSKRMAHTAVSLSDGRVVVMSGISTGVSIFVTPTYITTPSCDLFDTSFGPMDPMPSAGAAGAAAASMLDGNVWHVGGGRGFPATTGVAQNTSLTLLTQNLSTANPDWITGPSLTEPVADHRILRFKNDRTHVTGGADAFPQPTAFSSQHVHRGNTILETAANLPVARSGHVLVPLTEGTALVAGGQTLLAGAPTPLADVRMYTPFP